ncbi:glycosyltransferase family 39 protein [Thalassoglobus sp.]|uniref:glycosyltransferase family 39 protein n=1 Tax=Thalassoglobus sp. TaxID=2795869 RepID=UPI003AA7FF92
MSHSFFIEYKALMTNSSPKFGPEFFQRLKFICVVVLGGLGFSLILVSRMEFAAVRAFLDQFSGDGAAEPYTEQVHRNLGWIAFSLGLLLSLLSLAIAKLSVRFYMRCLDSMDVGQRSRNSFRWLKVSVHQNRGWLLGLTLLSFILRWSHLHEPIRFDEAHTFLTYAKSPWFVGISLYQDPNNHVFNTLLIHCSTTVFGNAEWAIRLPAFIAGVLLAPLTFLAGRITVGRDAGIAAGTLVAVSSALIEYSGLGRGYTLICCLTMLNILFAVRILRNQTGWEWWLLTFCSALGLWTIPVMVYSNILVWGWLLYQGMLTSRRKSDRLRFMKRWSIAVGMTCLLALGFYLPVIATSGIHSLTGEGFVQEGSLVEFLMSLVNGLAEGFSFWFRDWSFPAILLLFGLGVIGLVAAKSVGQSLRQIFALLIPGAICLLFLVFQRVVPPPRVGLFLIPLFAIYSGRGYALLLSGRERPRRNFIRAVWFAVIVILPVMQQVQHQTIRNSRETGVCPEAAELVQFLQQEIETGHVAANTSIITVSPASAPIVYYFLRNDSSLEHFSRPTRENAHESVVVVSHSGQQSVSSVLTELGIDDLVESDDFAVFKQFQTVTLYHIPSQD